VTTQLQLINIIYYIILLYILILRIYTIVFTKRSLIWHNAFIPTAYNEKLTDDIFWFTSSHPQALVTRILKVNFLYYVHCE
jgi:hypothetical protein